MRVPDSLCLWAATLLILPGGLCGDWSVLYPQTSICAVPGSTVVIPCSYNYPSKDRLKVNTVMWCINDTDCIADSETKHYVYHSQTPNNRLKFSQRIRYLGNKMDNCTLKITDVGISDQETYRFRFETNDPQGRWVGQPGVTLSITELKIQMSPTGKLEEVREGDNLNLSCVPEGCSLTQTEFTWFKNGQPLSSPWATENTLRFNPVSSEHAGTYSCALKGHAKTESVMFALDVRSEFNTLMIAAILGLVLLVSIATLVIYICIRRKKAGQLKGENSRNMKARDVLNNIYDEVLQPNIPESEHMQRTPSEEDEVCYSAVSFPPKTASCQETNDSSVLYSTLKR
uniref:B-cell receptor CD22-like n=1 Tax=Lepisosteus oculatus TaxID=7918 RepID=W5MCM3_LEPOC|nr:PREDICTED: B-cell receptor CD22-like [Lepisosteus oculatus]XP_015224207.1 PREDICTED: B-cell receptor CD22-like [Lepisosteus oculatus]